MTKNFASLNNLALCKEIKAKIDYLKFKDIGESLFQDYSKYELSHIDSYPILTLIF